MSQAGNHPAARRVRIAVERAGPQAREVVVRVEGPEADAELVADDLLASGASAVAEEPAGPGRVRLTANPDTVPPLREGWRAEQLVVDPTAGLDAWRAYARLERAGERIVLRPPWVDHESARPGEVVVVLDPGRAFGSGSHPTTRLVLGEVERLVRGGERVVDVGCGSGVLGVTAALFGASSVLAVDVDPEAVRATEAVAAANGVAERVHASTTPVEHLDGPAELVLANIGARALVALAPALQALVAPGGHLVLAGFLESLAADVAGAHPELVEVARIRDHEWVALVLARVSA